MTPDILFADNHLLAADKPAGLPTQRDTRGRPGFEDAVRAHVRIARAKPGEAFVHAAHRLDREVGGVVLFALTGKALARLNAQQRAGAWDKRYRAWVEGAPAAATGILTHWLRHGDHRADVVAAGTPEARACRLTYRLLRAEDGLSLLEIGLETGRYHQIRAQLAAAGWPICGDVRYGARRAWAGAGIALRHVRLTLEHPVRHTPLCLEAPAPAFL